MLLCRDNTVLPSTLSVVSTLLINKESVNELQGETVSFDQVQSDPARVEEPVSPLAP